jgi:RNA polymerase sigma-70 factor (ECF subfamily)
MRPKPHHLSHAIVEPWDWADARMKCLRYARRMLRNEADAEEAVQEALTRAWRKREQCRDAAVPWMLEITRNEALRIVARRREDRPIEEVPDRAGCSPADEVLRRVSVADALDRLPSADRALLRLRYEADLTQSAVAKRTGLPEGTVKVRLHRLRKQLRAALQEAE